MADIVSTLRGVNASSFDDMEERRTAISETRALLSRLETPWDTAVRLCHEMPALLTCLKTAIDLQLLEKWLADNDGAKHTAAELAKLVGCDASLLSRLLRHMAACNVLFVDAEGCYEMTPYMRSLVEEDLASVILHAYMLTPVRLHLPQYLKENEYKDPSGNKADCLAPGLGGLMRGSRLLSARRMQQILDGI